MELENNSSTQAPDTPLEQTPTEPTENFSAGFAAGFNRVRGFEEPVTEEKPAETAPPVPTPEPTAPETPLALIAGMTEDDLRNRLQQISQLEQDFRRQIDDINGKYGRLKQVVESAQQTTPKGEPVEIGEEDLAALKEQYPELTSTLAKDLNVVLKKLGTVGTGSTAPQGVPREELDQLFNERFGNELGKIRGEFQDRLAISMLDFQHPDRMQVQDSPEFNDWLKSKPAEYQQEVESTWDYRVVGQCLDDYKKWRDEQARSRQRVANAITPTHGATTAPPSTPNPSALFAKGFNRARGMT